MLTEEQCRNASVLLDGLWAEGRQIDHLPEQLRPDSRAEAYRVQGWLEQAPPRKVAGWKIAATSAAGQAHINVDGPLAGRILEDRLLAPGETVLLAGNNMRVAELEFAFRMGRTLPLKPGGYGMDEVRDAVEALLPAIEIPASRYTDFCAVGAEALIADNSCASRFLFGPDFSPAEWMDRDMKSWQVTGTIEGKEPVQGVGANVLGDPWEALLWLVNECNAYGMALCAGQVVSTGTCDVPIAVAEGERLTADYGAGAPLGISFA